KTSAAIYLQYAPRATNVGTDQWNWQSKYENKGSPNFQPFGSTDQGVWKLKLQRDNTHFVTLTVCTVDTTAPAAPAVTSPSSALTINASTYTIRGTAEANALVKVWLDGNNNGAVDAGEAVVGSQQLGGGASAFAISVPLAQDAANHF